MRHHVLRLGLASLILVLLAAIASAQEAVQPGQTITIMDHKVVVYVASGTASLHRVAGRGLTIQANAQGPDGSQLRFFTDREGDAARFRVDFPDDADHIAAPAGTRGNTNLRLRDDGTFGGDDSWRRGRGDEVEIGGSGGFRGWAALDIGVPEGTEVLVRLAAGRASADGVSGRITLDTWSADCEATNIGGRWLFDTGSGDVTVRDATGVVFIDTGSGSGSVSGMRGDTLDLDTGSGDVTVADVTVGKVRFDTGSGSVRARNLSAPRGVADTGSGDVVLEYAEGGVVEDLYVDTGSGAVDLALPRQVSARVSIDTGSGGVTVQRAGVVFERRDDDGTILRIGEGANRIRIDTGSGGVTIR
jgi:putative adhesin